MSIPFLYNVNKLTLADESSPVIFRQLAVPPKQLYVMGTPLDEIIDRPRVAIVGSRKVSPYGREATTKLAYDLVRHGVAVISGLALGVNALAHKAALEAGGTTVAVLPGRSPRFTPHPTASLPGRSSTVAARS